MVYMRLYSDLDVTIRTLLLLVECFKTWRKIRPDLSVAVSYGSRPPKRFVPYSSLIGENSTHPLPRLARIERKRRSRRPMNVHSMLISAPASPQKLPTPCARMIRLVALVGGGLQVRD